MTKSPMKRPYKIGQYTILDKLGEGGFGIVRKAIRDEDGKLVAIKIFDKYDLQLHEMTQQVKQEIAILTSLHHPAIVKGYQVLCSKAKIFIVMEYVGGGDFHTLLSQRNKLTELESKIMFRTILDGLAYCHSKGVYHRDLKLENLLLTTDGNLKVCDFGLASVKAMNPNHNMCQTVVGTKSFSPPEIIRSIPYKGDKADMWSSGIILYIMLTGFSPFESKNQKDLVKHICAADYSFPSTFPPLARKLVESLLVVDPEKRLSASEALECEWFSGQSPKSIKVKSTATPISSPETNQNRRLPRPKRRALTEELTSSENEEQFNNLARSFNSMGSRTSHQDLHVMYGALGRAKIPSFSSLYGAMRDPKSGITVKDRKWRFRTFERCFIGSEAIDWLSRFAVCSRSRAIRLGQQLLEIGAIHHVCRDHNFHDEYLFYQWHDDDPQNMMVANLNTPYTKNNYHLRADLATRDVLNLLLSQCKLHQGLHDLRIVNILGLQNDSQLKVFFDAATELQATNFNTMPRYEHKTAFLVNMHNLLWIVARICIGDFEAISYDDMELTASRFEYMIGNLRISLLDIYRLLFDRCEREDSLLSEPELTGFNRTQNDTKRAQRKKIPATKKMSSFIARVVPKGSGVDPQLEDLFKDFEVSPLVHFLTSDASPNSPTIYPVTGADITSELYHKCAAEYLNMALHIDNHTNTVLYTEKVARYRDAIQADHDEYFVAILSTLCKGQPMELQLKNFLRKCHEEKNEVHATINEQEIVSSLRTKFAPIYGILRD